MITKIFCKILSQGREKQGNIGRIFSPASLLAFKKPREFPQSGNPTTQIWSKKSMLVSIQSDFAIESR
jgi:hypothetical protein